MNHKRIYDAAMIFVIGVAPLGFEILKSNVQITSLIPTLQNDIDEHQAKQKSFFKPKYQIKQILEKDLKPKISESIDKRIEILKKWKKSSYQKYLPQVLAISGIHTIGGFMYPSAFFLSIFSYFILYQMNFINELFILKGKQSIFRESSFQFQKVNKLYLIFGLSGIGLAGLSKGFAKLNKKVLDNNFK